MVARTFAQGVVAVLGDIFLLAGIIVAMLLMNWKLALVVFTTVPLLVLATAIFRAKVRVSYRKVRTRLARINAYLQEHLQGVEVVKLFNVEAKEFRGFDRANKDHLLAHFQNLFYYAVFFPTVEFIGAIALALILWYGGLGIIGGTVTFGVVVAFLQYSERFYQPIRDLSDKYNVLQAAMVSSPELPWMPPPRLLPPCQLCSLQLPPSQLIRPMPLKPLSTGSCSTTSSKWWPTVLVPTWSAVIRMWSKHIACLFQESRRWLKTDTFMFIAATKAISMYTSTTCR